MDWNGDFRIYFALGLGLVSWLGAFYWFRRVSSFAANALKVRGVVIELVKDDSGDGLIYRPLVRFIDLSGIEQNFQGQVGSNPSAFKVGELVKVLYHPEQPEKARIDAPFSLWGGPIVLAAAGALLIFAGLIQLPSNN